ncbi:MAG: hypothetical protein AB1601_11335 [Planctomycetota bacterium]
MSAQSRGHATDCMGETRPVIREFIGEEPIDDTHTGLYEVDAESYLLADECPLVAPPRGS